MLGLGLSIPNSRRTGGGVQGPIVVAPVPGTPLLDAYPGAAAAYSLRQLSSSFTGPVVRVRRSSDNAESDIGLVNGMLNEAALLAFVGTGDAFVTTWYDQSGNARNATQATAANQPRIVLGGVVDKVNGRASPIFSTARATALVFNGFALGPASYAASVAKNTQIVGQSPVFFCVSDAQAVGYNLRRNSNAQFQVAGVATQSDGPLAVGATALQSINYASVNSVETHVNGVAVAVPGLTPLPTGTVSLAIGNEQSNANIQANYFDGYVPESLLYPTSQSANRAAIEANIINYYSIT